MICMHISSINRMPLQHHPSSSLQTNQPPQGLLARSRARSRSSENCDRAFATVTAEQQRAMEGKEEEEKKSSSFAEEEAMAVASPAATILAFLARPLSLLRHVAHGLASRLKPAASASASAYRTQQQEAAAVVTEEVVVVEMRSRGMVAPQRPRGRREGNGGNGGAHH